MRALRSYVCGEWHTASEGFADLRDPVSEEVIARASSAGVDFGAVLSHARIHGGPALRAMTFAERGRLLKSLSKALLGRRDELIKVSIQNTGTTVPDAAFDLDGASGTLAYYAFLAKQIGDARVLPDGVGEQLGKNGGPWSRHVRVPLAGVALHINAFNFPAWGFAEKLACSLLAGVPVVSKPATSSALVTERCAEAILEVGVLPDGAFQLICGSTGDLVARLGAQDVLAFTGSADTALRLRRAENLLATNARVSIEADSLNAAVLAPEAKDDTCQLFAHDVAREITQKTGQKCTAVRRVFVPSRLMDAVESMLISKLECVVTGNPRDESVRMGPLATEKQLRDAVSGVAMLAKTARIVHGSGQRIDGVSAARGQGYFFGPTLLRAEDAAAASVVHKHEVFGPVATLLPYSGEAADAAALVAQANGTLVTSLYSDNLAWIENFLHAGGAHTGRLYIGSAQGMGSGLVLPQSRHGGPGRAGGGSELGGLRGLELYTQLVAVQGEKSVVESFR